MTYLSSRAVDLELFDPLRWGVPPEAGPDVTSRLHRLWTRFRPNFTTQTRDSSTYAWIYLRGLLLMENDRNFAHISRRVLDPTDDGQNLQHFMSDSPWSARAVLDQIQTEIAATPALQTGTVLILDESADKKAGPHSAGAGRQYNGRLGKVELSQVGVFLAVATERVWTWVDGELYLPAAWFTPEMAAARHRVGLPPERQFATKIELGWLMIQRVLTNGLPFEAVLCDDLYGRSGWLRRHLDEANLLYLADVPANTLVYVTRPEVGLPPSPPGRGRPPTRRRVLNELSPVEVHQVARRPDTQFTPRRIRRTERGELERPVAMRRVWTLHEGELREEWLVICQEGPNCYYYALSNAPADTEPAWLAWLTGMRYFVERANQDAKSEMGWAEFQARKYRAWEHHLALTALATWFITETKLDWAQTAVQDPALAQQLEVQVLPTLSVANVRELLRATMPLKQLSPAEAEQLVITHLWRRARSMRSRVKAQREARRRQRR